MFSLHPQLAQDSVLLGQLNLCELRLMNRRHFPWLLLVPARANLVEITDLNDPDRIQLMHEIATVSDILKHETKADKLNVAMLGNMVPQLHVHIIARFKSDPAWPSPIWGHPSAAIHYCESELLRQNEKWKAHFSKVF